MEVSVKVVRRCPGGVIVSWHGPCGKDKVKLHYLINGTTTGNFVAVPCNRTGKPTNSGPIAWSAIAHGRTRRDALVNLADISEHTRSLGKKRAASVTPQVEVGDDIE